MLGARERAAAEVAPGGPAYLSVNDKQSARDRRRGEVLYAARRLSKCNCGLSQLQSTCKQQLDPLKHELTPAVMFPDSSEGWAGSEMMRQDDEFMLFKFKVLPCTRKGAHSWTECCFTHPGEKAARRDPRTHVYSAEACPDARKSGKCVRGDLCPYSHGVFEQWLHPSRYRTQLCSFGTACRRPVCFFAHTVQELRVPTPAGQGGGSSAGASVMAFPAAALYSAAAPGAAAAAGVGGGSSEEAYAMLMQQALLAQMGGASAHAVDGATATMINRYQAASCAALANAAACQRQQQQHQAAAAAAAAAAIAAAAHNPASLLSMAQAAQAYQAAAAAAAAAAANVPMPALGSGPGSMMAQSSSSRSSSSNVSSPTCSSNNSNMTNSSVPSSLAAFGDGSEQRAMEQAAAAGVPTSGARGGGLYDSLLLQQALLGGGGSCWAGESAKAAQLAACSLPWGLPAGRTSSPLQACSLALPEAPLGCGYPSALMPATPAISDAPSLSSGPCGFDMLAGQLSRQLSMQAAYQP